MRILLLSDTHGHMDEAILAHAQEADEIWHAGDIGPLNSLGELAHLRPFRAVFGNIDGSDVRQTYPQDLHFTCEGARVWMTHIGGYPGRFPPRIRQELDTARPDIFVCGHSHILKVMRDPKRDLLCLNPGAAGHNGFHKQRTMLRFTLTDGRPGDMAVIELGPRGRNTR